MGASLPIPLRLLLAAQPKLVTPVLRVERRVITRVLLKQAGVKAHEADSGAVTLIQRFGSAANLNIHLHCLVLDGVYRLGTDGAQAFVEVPAPTDEALHAMLHKMITHPMKRLTRRGVLVEEEGSTYKADNDGDSDEARVLRPLPAKACTFSLCRSLRQFSGPVAPAQAAAQFDSQIGPRACARLRRGDATMLAVLKWKSNYRIAFGPRAGQKVLTLLGPKRMQAQARARPARHAQGDGLQADMH